MGRGEILVTLARFRDARKDRFGIVRIGVLNQASIQQELETLLQQPSVCAYHVGVLRQTAEQMLADWLQESE